MSVKREQAAMNLPAEKMPFPVALLDRDLVELFAGQDDVAILERALRQKEVADAELIAEFFRAGVGRRQGDVALADSVASGIERRLAIFQCQSRFLGARFRYFFL